MTEHIKFISVQVNRSYDQLVIDVNNNNHYNHNLPVIDAVTTEDIRLGGIEKKIRRVFVRTQDSDDYAKLGWVLLEDIDCCMVCLTSFQGVIYNHRKNHCKACGNVVCANCADSYSLIKELRSDVPVRVCQICYFGQDIVDAHIQNEEYKTPTPPIFETENIMEFTEVVIEQVPPKTNEKIIEKHYELLLLNASIVLLVLYALYNKYSS